MRIVLSAAAAVGLLCAVPAMAQTTGSTSPTNPNTSTAATDTPVAPGTMQRDVKNDLEKAGFTDVKVMPSSFLVRAKDKQGRPVMMVINPDSVTEITNVAHMPAKTGGTAKN